MQATAIFLKDLSYAVRTIFFHLRCFHDMMSSSRFRRQVKFLLGKKFIRQLIRRCQFRRNRINPTVEDGDASIFSAERE